MAPLASSFGDHMTGNLCSGESLAAVFDASLGPLEGSLEEGVEGCLLFSGFSARLPMFRILRLAVDPSLTNYG